MQGGCTIQQLRDDTGARIKVEAELAGCSERLILISSPDDADMEVCRAQQALYSIQARLAEQENAPDGLCSVRKSMSSCFCRTCNSADVRIFEIIQVVHYCTK